MLTCFLSLLLVYFKVWTIAIICYGYHFPRGGVASAIPILFNQERGKSKTANIFDFLIPAYWDNTYKARYVRQTSLYHHFAITVSFLLLICFMDPNLVNIHFENDYGVASLHWADLESSQNASFKYLAVGLSLGCGIFTILGDLLITICWWVKSLIHSNDAKLNSIKVAK